MGCAVGLTAGIGGYLLAENLNVYLVSLTRGLSKQNSLEDIETYIYLL